MSFFSCVYYQTTVLTLISFFSCVYYQTTLMVHCCRFSPVCIIKLLYGYTDIVFLLYVLSNYCMDTLISFFSCIIYIIKLLCWHCCRFSPVCIIKLLCLHWCRFSPVCIIKLLCWQLDTAAVSLLYEAFQYVGRARTKPINMESPGQQRRSVTSEKPAQWAPLQSPLNICVPCGRYFRARIGLHSHLRTHRTQSTA